MHTGDPAPSLGSGCLFSGQAPADRVGAMFKRKSKTGKTGKLVWRISAAAPLGEYVHADESGEASAPVEDPSARRTRQDSRAVETPDEITERGWHQSSMDLAKGMDIIEEAHDTLPSGLPDPRARKRP